MSLSRLDNRLFSLGMVSSRSQAENYIKLGLVKVDKKVVRKPGASVDEKQTISLNVDRQYVGRAGMKLESVADVFGLDFNNKTVLDVGSSTGGFTDFALQNRASKVIAVDVGSEQLSPILRHKPNIELHEKTDIRDFKTNQTIDIVLADVSFISLRSILPSVSKLVGRNTQIIVMVKPQFEASNSNLKHKGVIKNNKLRRQILKDFEGWLNPKYIVINKADSKIKGATGNLERFYLLQKA